MIKSKNKTLHVLKWKPVTNKLQLEWVSIWLTWRVFLPFCIKYLGFHSVWGIYAKEINGKVNYENLALMVYVL